MAEDVRNGANDTDNGEFSETSSVALSDSPSIRDGMSNGESTGDRTRVRNSSSFSGSENSPHRKTLLTLQRGGTTELPGEPEKAYNLLLEYIIQGKVKAITQLLESYYHAFSCQFSETRVSNNQLCHPDTSASPNQFQSVAASKCSSSHRSRSVSLDDIHTDLIFSVNNIPIGASQNLVHTAVSLGQVQVLEALLQFGGDVNVQDKMGMTCLHIASRKKSNATMVICLKDGDANIVDNEGLLPLHWAASCGIVDNVAALVEVTENINHQDKQGRTVLHHAAINGHGDVLRHLLQRELNVKLDINALDMNGETALVLALSQRDNSVVSPCVNALLKHGSDVTIPNQRGEHVLQLCLNKRLFNEAFDITRSYQNFIKVLEVPIEMETVSYDVMREFVEFIFREHPEVVWDMWHDLRDIVVDCAQELVNCSRPVLSFPLFVRLLKLVKELGVSSVGQISNKGPVSKRMLSFSPRNPQQVEKLILNRTIEIVTQNIASHGESSKCDDTDEALDDVWKFLRKWMRLVKSYHTRTRRDSYRFMRRPYEFDANDLRDVAPQLCSLIKGYHIWAEGTSQYKEFLNFISEFSPVIKLFLAFNTELIFGPLDFLLSASVTSVEFYNIRRTVLDVPLELRKEWFYDRLYGDAPPDDPNVLSERLNIFFIDRDKIFTTSCEQVMNARGDFLVDSLTINFQGDDGMGVGVRREWFTLLTEKITDPMYGLFQRYNDGLNFQPTHLSKINPDHLRHFEFAGKMIALMIYYQNTTNIHFTRCFYKHMLGEPIDSTDVICIDNDLAMSLQWLLDNDISDMTDLTFSVDEDEFGEYGTLDLKPGGSEITVTEDNKVEYVHLLSEYKMTGSIKPQISSFLTGVYSIVPRNLLAIFSPEELELILCGLDTIDCADWKRHTQYVNFTPQDDMIVWFWEVVESLSQDELVVLLKFITGYSKVPHGGFSQFAVIGSSGPVKISRGNGISANLPKSSVCFNLLMLPVYTSKEMLRDRLTTAMSYASVGFDQC